MCTLSVRPNDRSYMPHSLQRKHTQLHIMIKYDSARDQDISIPRVDNARFLGVHIDQCLTWKTHISSVSSKVAKNIGILSRLSYLLPIHILTSLYYAMVHPYLSYCSIIWASDYPA